MICVVLDDSRSTNIFLKCYKNGRQGFFVRSKRHLVNTATVLLETDWTRQRPGTGKVTVAAGCVRVCIINPH